MDEGGHPSGVGGHYLRVSPAEPKILKPSCGESAGALVTRMVVGGPGVCSEGRAESPCGQGCAAFRSPWRRGQGRLAGTRAVARGFAKELWTAAGVEGGGEDGVKARSRDLLVKKRRRGFCKSP